MDHDHDHKISTGFIKVDNQIIFTQKFAKKPIQIYESMVNVLKQLKNTKRVNEALKNELHERKDHDKKRAFTPASFTTFQRIFKFFDPEKHEELAKYSNRSNMICVLDFGQIITGTSRKTWNLIMPFLVWKMSFGRKCYLK